MSIEHIVFDFKTAKQAWFEELEALYCEKLKHFCKFSVQHLKSSTQDRDNKAEKLKYEEAVLLKKITKDDFVILLDERGKSLDSIQFSNSHQKAMQSGKKRIVFIVGGAYGVSDTIRNSAHLVLSLSGLVMNHLVAEAVLLEQIYRSFTIINRIPYHNS